MSPSVSVLLAYRDAADTIEEALDSVLAQRGVSHEVIAVDDGSRDDSAARVERLASRHRILRTVSSSPIGLPRALNLAAGQARSPLLARMDADDVSHPDRLAIQVDALTRSPELAALGSRVRAFPLDRIGQGLACYVEWLNSLVTPAEHAREIFVESPLCHPSVVMRRAALEEVGGYREGPFAEDYDLWLRFVERGLPIAKVPEVLLEWRHSDRRLTFTDARYALERHRALKAPFLARFVARRGRPLVVWGAGPTGRRLARELEAADVRPRRFVDVDPKKIGRTARGLSIEAPSSLEGTGEQIVVAVGARGARQLIRAELARLGLREPDDYVCAA